MDMNEIFLLERKKEKELYAHIDFFKLLLICEASRNNYELFCLMDGLNKLRKLYSDIKNQNITLFIEKDSKQCEKTILELSEEMYAMKEELSKINISKSTPLNNAIREAELYLKYEEENFISIHNTEYLKTTAYEYIFSKLPLRVQSNVIEQNEEKVEIQKILERG